MWAMIVKEFRQLRRDRRTLAMMIVMPVILLIVFGYAASFDVKTVPTVAAGPQGPALATSLGEPFDVVATAPDEGRAWAETQLRDNTDGAAMAVVAGSGPTEVLIDGSQLFTARTALAALTAKAAKAAAQGATAPSPQPKVTVLYNPDLTTADIMIPGLCGVVLVFIGTIITALGVVRERQSGTLEQLAVMPLRPRDVFLGKVVPYFGVAALDLAIVVGVGVGIFGVPFRGSYAVFALGAILFLFVTLGLGVLISSVSENQGQAIQLSMMVILPQILLSGLIFPLSSIAVGVRWISYLLPLTYFNQISRGVMLRAEPIGPLWQPFVFLALLGLIVFTLASLRFRSFLAPAAPRRGKGRAPAGQESAAVEAGRAGTEAGTGAGTGAGAGTGTGAGMGAGAETSAGAGTGVDGAVRAATGPAAGPAGAADPADQAGPEGAGSGR
jgi:ABC-2 type transport system permease protein